MTWDHDDDYYEDDDSECLLPNVPHENLEEYWMFQSYDMIPFWQRYRSWLYHLGFSLYELRSYWRPPPVTAAANGPFAIRLSNDSEELAGRSVVTKFAMGQDASGNDVFLKLTNTGSSEYRINRYLLSHSEALKAGSFPHVLRPVAVLESPYNFSFIVMPLWGAGFEAKDFDSIRLVLVFIKCLLTGLSFLHEHRIAHRDIQDLNVLVNGYCPELEDSRSATRTIIKAHMSSPDVSFCLFDFDHAVQFPADVSLKHFRRPALEGNRGSPAFHPPDIATYAPEYNPFAFDVGCMGMMFIYYFSEAVRVVPQLAPLYARMTTHIVEQRFTAAEALSFFNDHLAELPDEVISRAVVSEPTFEPIRDPELYWSLLGLADRHRWREYKVPARSWGERLVLWMSRSDTWWRIVRYVRRTLRI